MSSKQQNCGSPIAAAMVADTELHLITAEARTAKNIQIHFGFDATYLERVHFCPDTLDTTTYKNAFVLVDKSRANFLENAFEQKICVNELINAAREQNANVIAENSYFFLAKLKAN